MLRSKKLWATVVGILGVILSTTLGLPRETVAEITGLLASYLIGQGIADHGKEAAKIAAGPVGGQP